MVNIIKSSYSIEPPINGIEMIKNIERAGRTCYKSENKITKTSSTDFIAMIIKNGHESVLEHEKVTVRVICDRGLTHEIVRHRIASYSQESTRYCNYTKGKFGSEISVMMPVDYLNKEQIERRMNLYNHVEKVYEQEILEGIKPQIARGNLQISLKTEIIITYNLREWRHFFKLRTSPRAHPQLRDLTIPMLREFQQLIPIVFDDIIID